MTSEVERWEGEGEGILHIFKRMQLSVTYAQRDIKETCHNILEILDCTLLKQLLKLTCFHFKTGRRRMLTPWHVVPS